MFSAAKIAAPSAGGYTLTKSLRFRSSASAYLNRTPASSTNQTTWTWSGWVKRGLFSPSTTPRLFDAGTASTGECGITLNSDHIEVYQYASSYTFQVVTTPVYRDPSSWYHIIVVYDSTQATSTNRIKIYVNGIQVTSFGTASYPSLNFAAIVNTTVPHYHGFIGSGVSSNYYDGYMAEVNFIDGQALTPSSFGSFSSTTGVWQPAKYTGTYGTNGFYLPFTNTTSTTTLGYDSSGNGNNWTVNNISLTAGSTYDSMTDVPTLTSATVANYCVLNQSSNASGSYLFTLSNGNLSYSASASTGNAPRMCVAGTMAMTGSGKYYFEGTETSSNSCFGITTGFIAGGNAQGSQYVSVCPGSTYTSAATYSGTTPSYGSGDVIGLAFDVAGLTMAVYKNGSLLGTFSGIESGKTWFFYITPNTAATSTSNNVNFGQQPFTYTPPSGFVALNAYNLPTGTILAGNKYMDATLYTGNGGTQTITNAAGFQPDLVWLKARSNAYGHILEDSVRGALQYLASESTSAESTLAGSVTSFNSNGFSVGNQAGSNGSGVSLVGWQWQAGKGTTSSNTNGSITSTVSVNASAGFSVVTFKGTGANATVGHGLGVAPSFIIVKDRTYSYNWYTYHISLGNTNFTALNTTSVYSPDSTVWNNTSPTSSVFSIGTNVNVNANNDNFVAYCWAAIPGFSAFGSYTGNGSTSGPFIYTGFRPKFILWKCSTSAYDWDIYDTSRDPYNSAYHRLIPDSSGAEQTLSPPTANILSNGFNLIYGYSSSNNNGDTYIYAAFAENPFKYALAR